MISTTSLLSIMNCAAFPFYCLPTSAAAVTIGKSPLLGWHTWSSALVSTEKWTIGCRQWAPHPQLPKVSDITWMLGSCVLVTHTIDIPFYSSINVCHHSMSALAAVFRGGWNDWAWSLHSPGQVRREAFSWIYAWALPFLWHVAESPPDSGALFSTWLSFQLWYPVETTAWTASQIAASVAWPLCPLLFLGTWGKWLGHPILMALVGCPAFCRFWWIKSST